MALYCGGRTFQVQFRLFCPVWQTRGSGRFARFTAVYTVVKSPYIVTAYKSRHEVILLKNSIAMRDNYRIATPD